MTQPDAGPEPGPPERLYAMMQHLMTLAAQGQQPTPAPGRFIATGDDAVDAVLQLAAVIDAGIRSGRIPIELGVHAAGMLMLIRDYLRPLPEGPLQDGRDTVGPDLAEMVRALRQAGSSAGVQG